MIFLKTIWNLLEIPFLLVLDTYRLTVKGIKNIFILMHKCSILCKTYRVAIAITTCICFYFRHLYVNGTLQKINCYICTVANDSPELFIFVTLVVGMIVIISLGYFLGEIFIKDKRSYYV